MMSAPKKFVFTSHPVNNRVILAAAKGFVKGWRDFMRAAHKKSFDDGVYCFYNDHDISEATTYFTAAPAAADAVFTEVSVILTKRFVSGYKRFEPDTERSEADTKRSGTPTERSEALTEPSVAAADG
jgi:hypothetical protein